MRADKGITAKMSTGAEVFVTRARTDDGDAAFDFTYSFNGAQTSIRLSELAVEASYTAFKQLLAQDEPAFFVQGDAVERLSFDVKSEAPEEA